MLPLSSIWSARAYACLTADLVAAAPSLPVRVRKPHGQIHPPLWLDAKDLGACINRRLREFCRDRRSSMGRRCENPTCPKQASYGLKGTARRQFCAQHAVDGMVDVCSKRCSREGCSKHATFGVPGSRKREFCSTHAAQGMVDLKFMKRCGFEGCYKHPSYGVVGGKREYCAEHAYDYMVDLKIARKCGREGCSKYPSFGMPGSKKREFCSQHAEEGMVDQKTMKRCEYIGCSKHPSYGAEGTSKRTFCAEHAEVGMVVARGGYLMATTPTDDVEGKQQTSDMEKHEFPDDLLEPR